MRPQVHKYHNISSRDVRACANSFVIIIIIIIQDLDLGILEHPLQEELLLFLEP